MDNYFDWNSCKNEFFFVYLEKTHFYNSSITQLSGEIRKYIKYIDTKKYINTIQPNK